MSAASLDMYRQRALKLDLESRKVMGLTTQVIEKDEALEQITKQYEQRLKDKYL